ncbi:hypothetical protein VP1G_00324 [Cytospora mali]|uniref:Uncharacterized protein n=1 Tax=Cytospora mali TaxID=578113 RepID=A0A194UMP8_CYTMA|nr:hypothetical protein VP1G_00324 [Valsa mali var. pyri (nom. inval.)]
MDVGNSPIVGRETGRPWSSVAAWVTHSSQSALGSLLPYSALYGVVHAPPWEHTDADETSPSLF